MDERKRQKALARRNRKAKKRNEQQQRHRAQPRPRTCGECRMCCYVFCVPDLAKKRHEWCRHVSADGCSLHDKERPAVCTDFACLWLAHPEVPERFRPDRIGCVAIELGNRVVVICQTYKGAAKRHDASWFIDGLVAAGDKVVVSWEKGEEVENQLKYDPKRYPVPPACEEFFAIDAKAEEGLRNIGTFEQTGQSPCLWQPQQAPAG